MTSEAHPVVQRFITRYGASPTFVARAPGRVNLIGEHIDYNGLAVLPMAIPRHIIVAGQPRSDPIVRLANATEGFTAREFALVDRIAPYPTGDWGNYAKAAVQALMGQFGMLTGMTALVGSTLPSAAGLGSSSALVIATAIALLHVNGRTIDPIDLAELMAAGERYVGTHGGGMDQAISLGAKAGTASRVDFRPLRLTPVPIPPSWRVVVAHSLTSAEKSGAQQETYNRRTRECRAALSAVADALASPESQREYPFLVAHHGTPALLAAGERVLEGDLARRFRHVVTEAARVHHAEEAMRHDRLDVFGTVLNASHASLRDDYAVSSPALDELCSIAVEAGAAGARLTGAGMGGCAVVACDASTVDRVMAALTEKFYVPRGALTDLPHRLFMAEPAAGATVAPL